MKFTLIGRPGLVFIVKAKGPYAGIECVLGWTEDNKYQTLARVVDVVFVE